MSLPQEQIYFSLLKFNFDREIMDRYNGKQWGQSGGGALTRALSRLCKTRRVNLMIKSKCHGFHVLPTDVCYPITFEYRMQMMEPENSVAALKKVENSSIVHFWISVTRNYSLNVNSQAPYVKLAKKYCPRVMERCSKYFWMKNSGSNKHSAPLLR